MHLRVHSDEWLSMLLNTLSNTTALNGLVDQWYSIVSMISTNTIRYWFIRDIDSLWTTNQCSGCRSVSVNLTHIHTLRIMSSTYFNPTDHVCVYHSADVYNMNPNSTHYSPFVARNSLVITVHSCVSLLSLWSIVFYSTNQSKEAARCVRQTQITLSTFSFIHIQHNLFLFSINFSMCETS